MKFAVQSFDLIAAEEFPAIFRKLVTRLDYYYGHSENRFDRA